MPEIPMFQRRADRQRMSPEREQLTPALLLSLLIHILLLSLTFGGQGIGLPGFRFPWQDRRIEVTILHVTVVPEEVATAEPSGTPVAEPLQQEKFEQPVARPPTVTPSLPRAPTPRRTTAAIVPEAHPRTARVDANPRADTATDAPLAQIPSRADRPADTTPPPKPAPSVIALAPSDDATWVVPVTPANTTPAIAAAGGQDGRLRAEQLEAARREAALQESARTENARLEAEHKEAARIEAARIEATKVEAAKVEAAKVETAKVEAAKIEAAKIEAAKVEAAKVEAAKVETAKVEAARVEAAKVEAAKVEAAKVEAAKVEAAKVEAAKVEAAKSEAAKADAAKAEAARTEAAKAEAAKAEAAKAEAAKAEAARAEAARAEAAKAEAAKAEAARAEAAKAEAAKVEAAKTEAAQEAAARREATLRAIGRQLDEESTRREAAKREFPSSSSARRYWLFGRTDSNAELIEYVEAWSRKIEMNMTFDIVREAAKQPHADPLVTVAMRSDGSVESVTFVKSSGVAAIDDAIRRVVDSQRPYQAFPPGLAREFDVIMIRRTWHFDMAIRLY